MNPYDYSVWPTEEILVDLRRLREIQPKMKMADMLIRCTRMMMSAEEELKKRGVKA
jgi:hypothetical protein